IHVARSLLGFATQALDSSAMTTPAAPAPTASGTRRPAPVEPKSRNTIESTAGSGTASTLTRPATVAGRLAAFSRSKVVAENLDADTSDRVAGSVFTTATTCPAVVSCSSASLQPAARTKAHNSKRFTSGKIDASPNERAARAANQQLDATTARTRIAGPHA